MTDETESVYQTGDEPHYRGGHVRIPKVNTLSRNTLIPAGGVLLVIVPMLAWIGTGVMNRLEGMEGRLDVMGAAMQRTNGRLDIMDVRSGDRWTASDMRTALERLGRVNPAMEIPDISDLIGDMR